MPLGSDLEYRLMRSDRDSMCGTRKRLHLLDPLLGTANHRRAKVGRGKEKALIPPLLRGFVQDKGGNPGDTG